MILVDAAIDRKLRALYVYSVEMLYADSNSNSVAEAFSKLEFVIAQEIFRSKNGSGKCREPGPVLLAS